MGYKGNSVQGEIPESGAIFMSNIKTHKECLERKLFGLPSGKYNFVLHVKEGMTLFLFEFERRLLYGVFRATCDGDINIEPKAFRSSGKQFPAQVRFTTVYDCSPLAEHEFKDVISGNYYSGKKFHFGLNKKQVSKLMKLFRSKLISRNHPERNIWRYDDEASEGNARSGDLRNDIRHRIRFDSCDSRGAEIKKVDDDMYVNKHIIESRHYNTTESDEFGDCSRHDILGKHLNRRKNDIEDGYMPAFSKPHRTHLDGIGVGSSEFLMGAENRDIIDYKRLQSLNEYPCFDDGSSFIPISNNYPVYRSPEKIPMTKPRLHYSYDEGSNWYLDDPGSQSSIFPKFISRNLSSPDAGRQFISRNLSSPDVGLHVHEVNPTYNGKRLFEKHESKHSFEKQDGLPVHEVDPTYNDKRLFEKHESKHSFEKHVGLRAHKVDPTYNDKRLFEKHESKHSFGTFDKRVSVFSRLTRTLRHEEQDFESDEKHELSSSVEVMKMLEKVVSSPEKRSGKSLSVYNQEDADKSLDSKIEDKVEVYEFSDVNFEVDADMADEEVDGESVFQETRLVDFKRRKKSNKRTDGTSKENSECLVGATSDAGPVADDQSTGMPYKRRKLVRPAFVEKNVVPDSVNAHENTLSVNDNADVVLESSEKVDDIIKPMVPTCHENTRDDSNSTKVGTENSKKANVSIKHIDLNMLPTCDESSSPKDDNNSSKLVLESQKSGNEGDGNAENGLVSGVFVEGSAPKDDQNMCGWIEW